MLLHRRTLLGSTAAMAVVHPTFVRPALARPATVGLTPELIAAAKAEGKIAWYTADDLVLATKAAKTFEAKYGITVQLERSGAERIYQRIGQEYGSNVHAVDVATTADVGHCVTWKAANWLTPYVPTATAAWPDAAVAEDGTYIVDKFTLVISGYNSRLVKAEEAPKAWVDLLDPKWKGKMVKAHPGYSGAITNATFALSRLLGWEFFEKLAKQGVMQVQSATDPPTRCAQGERAVMADAAEVTTLRLIGQGAPLVPIYPSEGTPVVAVASVLMTKAPRPNAARLFLHYLASTECQQLNLDHGSRSFDPSTKEPASWMPIKQIKLLHNDPTALAQATDGVKKRYSQVFGV